jgi:hypothetical protein
MADMVAPSATKARRSPPHISPLAKDRGEWFARRNENHEVAIRHGFVRSADWQTPPPLARIFRAGEGRKGGRGGVVALKLYLSTLLISRWGDPTSFPAELWAELFDLPDPPKQGARRIRDAIDWLERKQFMVVERRPGHPAQILPLDDRGTGETYLRPEGYNGDLYHRLPATIWSQGWICVLSGAALYVLLVLVDQGRKSIWISPSQRQRLYSLSDETFHKGSRELRDYGLATLSRKLQGQAHEFKRLRNIYNLDTTNLGLPPQVVWAPELT